MSWPPPSLAWQQGELATLIVMRARARLANTGHHDEGVARVK